MRFSPLSPRAADAQGVPIPKICFIIFYKSQSIETKIKRICDAFNANRYDLNNLNLMENRQIGNSLCTVTSPISDQYLKVTTLSPPDTKF